MTCSKSMKQKTNRWIHVLEWLITSGVSKDMRHAANQAIREIKDYQQATDLTKSLQGAAAMQPQVSSTQQVTSAPTGSYGASAMMPRTSIDKK